MTHVLVERSFATPVAFADIQALEDAGAWCLQEHQVTFSKTLFSTDRQRMLCFYTAPDAESVRRAQEQARVPFDVAWACQRIDPFAGELQSRAAESSVHVAVERRFPTPIEPEDVVRFARDGAWCLEMHRLDYVESYLSLDGLRLVCLFKAPDAESVRLANRTIGLPVEHLWAATVHGAPASAPDP